MEIRTLFLTITLALVGCSNSSQASLFIGEGCGSIQEWVVNVNKWVTFTKFFIALIFTFLSGVYKSLGQRNQFQAFGKYSTISYACLWMYFSISYVFEFAYLLECELTLTMEEFSTIMYTFFFLIVSFKHVFSPQICLECYNYITNFLNSNWCTIKRLL